MLIPLLIYLGNDAHFTHIQNILNVANGGLYSIIPEVSHQDYNAANARRNVFSTRQLTLVSSLTLADSGEEGSELSEEEPREEGEVWSGGEPSDWGGLRGISPVPCCC